MTEAMAEIFIRAEDAYLRHVPSLRSGTISIEPLVEDHPGPPVYITKQLTTEQRPISQRPEIHRGGPEKISSQHTRHDTSQKISQCLANALSDVETSLGTGSKKILNLRAQLAAALLRSPTSIHRQRNSGNVRGFIGGQKEGGVGHFTGITDSAKHSIVTLPLVVRVMGLR